MSPKDNNGPRGKKPSCGDETRSSTTRTNPQRASRIDYHENAGNSPDNEHVPDSPSDDEHEPEFRRSWEDEEDDGSSDEYHDSCPDPVTPTTKSRRNGINTPPSTRRTAARQRKKQTPATRKARRTDPSQSPGTEDCSESEEQSDVDDLLESEESSGLDKNFAKNEINMLSSVYGEETFRATLTRLTENIQDAQGNPLDIPAFRSFEDLLDRLPLLDQVRKDAIIERVIEIFEGDRIETEAQTKQNDLKAVRRHLLSLCIKAAGVKYSQGLKGEEVWKELEREDISWKNSTHNLVCLRNIWFDEEWSKSPFFHETIRYWVDTIGISIMRLVHLFRVAQMADGQRHSFERVRALVHREMLDRIKEGQAKIDEGRRVPGHSRYLKKTPCCYDFERLKANAPEPIHKLDQNHLETHTLFLCPKTGCLKEMTSPADWDQDAFDHQFVDVLEEGQEVVQVDFPRFVSQFTPEEDAIIRSHRTGEQWMDVRARMPKRKGNKKPWTPQQLRARGKYLRDAINKTNSPDTNSQGQENQSPSRQSRPTSKVFTSEQDDFILNNPNYRAFQEKFPGSDRTRDQVNARRGTLKKAQKMAGIRDSVSTETSSSPHESPSHQSPSPKRQHPSHEAPSLHESSSRESLSRHVSLSVQRTPQVASERPESPESDRRDSSVTIVRSQKATWEDKIPELECYNWEREPDSPTSRILSFTGDKGEFKVKVIPVEGDGNCYWRAIAYLLTRSEKNWRQMKSAHYSYWLSVKQSPNHPRHDYYTDLEDFTKQHETRSLDEQLSTENDWTSNLMTQITADLFDVMVVSCQKEKGIVKPQRFSGRRSARTLLICCRNSHWEPFIFFPESLSVHSADFNLEDYQSIPPPWSSQRFAPWLERTYNHKVKGYRKPDRNDLDEVIETNMMPRDFFPHPLYSLMVEDGDIWKEEKSRFAKYDQEILQLLGKIDKLQKLNQKLQKSEQTFQEQNKNWQERYENSQKQNEILKEQIRTLEEKCKRSCQCPSLCLCRLSAPEQNTPSCSKRKQSSIQPESDPLLLESRGEDSSRSKRRKLSPLPAAAAKSPTRPFAPKPEVSETNVEDNSHSTMVDFSTAAETSSPRGLDGLTEPPDPVDGSIETTTQPPGLSQQIFDRPISNRSRSSSEATLPDMSDLINSHPSIEDRRRLSIPQSTRFSEDAFDVPTSQRRHDTSRDTDTSTYNNSSTTISPPTLPNARREHSDSGSRRITSNSPAAPSLADSHSTRASEYYQSDSPWRRRHRSNRPQYDPESSTTAFNNSQDANNDSNINRPPSTSPATPRTVNRPCIRGVLGGVSGSNRNRSAGYLQ